MIDIGSHQAADEADVELTDLDVVLRKIMIDAVLALDAGKFITFFSIDDSSRQIRFSFMILTISAIRPLCRCLPDKARNGRGRHSHQDQTYIARTRGADLRRSLQQDAGKTTSIFSESCRCGIGQFIEIAGRPPVLRDELARRNRFVQACQMLFQPRSRLISRRTVARRS